MKMPYDFEAINPPVLTEKTLRKRMDVQMIRRQAALVSLAGLLMQLCLLVLAVFVYDTYPLLSTLAVCYVLVSSVGSGVLAAVFWKQRKVMIL